MKNLYIFLIILIVLILGIYYFRNKNIEHLSNTSTIRISSSNKSIQKWYLDYATNDGNNHNDYLDYTYNVDDDEWQIESQNATVFLKYSDVEGQWNLGYYNNGEPIIELQTETGTYGYDDLENITELINKKGVSKNISFEIIEEEAATTGATEAADTADTADTAATTGAAADTAATTGAAADTAANTAATTGAADTAEATDTVATTGAAEAGQPPNAPPSCDVLGEACDLNDPQIKESGICVDTYGGYACVPSDTTGPPSNNNQQPPPFNMGDVVEVDAVDIDGINTENNLTSGTYYISQTWDQETDYSREFIVSVPADDSKQYNLYISLHGAGGMATTDTVNSSILENYIVVAPQGYNNKWNSTKRENDDTTAPDVEFIEDIISKLTAFPNVCNLNGIIHGISNGASLTIKLIIQSELLNSNGEQAISYFIPEVTSPNLYQLRNNLNKDSATIITINSDYENNHSYLGLSEPYGIDEVKDTLTSLELNDYKFYKSGDDNEYDYEQTNSIFQNRNVLILLGGTDDVVPQDGGYGTLDSSDKADEDTNTEVKYGRFIDTRIALNRIAHKIHKDTTGEDLDLSLITTSTSYNDTIEYYSYNNSINGKASLYNFINEGHGIEDSQDRLDIITNFLRDISCSTINMDSTYTMDSTMGSAMEEQMSYTVADNNVNMGSSMEEQMNYTVADNNVNMGSTMGETYTCDEECSPGLLCNEETGICGYNKNDINNFIQSINLKMGVDITSSEYIENEPLLQDEFINNISNINNSNLNITNDMNDNLLNKWSHIHQNTRFCSNDSDCLEGYYCHNNKFCILSKDTTIETNDSTYSTEETTTPTATQQPATQQPATQQPATQQPVTQQPETQQPVTQQPATTTTAAATTTEVTADTSSTLTNGNSTSFVNGDNATLTVDLDLSTSDNLNWEITLDNGTEKETFTNWDDITSLDNGIRCTLDCTNLIYDNSGNVLYKGLTTKPKINGVEVYCHNQLFYNLSVTATDSNGDIVFENSVDNIKLQQTDCGGDFQDNYNTDNSLLWEKEENVYSHCPAHDENDSEVCYQLDPDNVSFGSNGLTMYLNNSDCTCNYEPWAEFNDTVNSDGSINSYPACDDTDSDKCCKRAKTIYKCSRMKGGKLRSNNRLGFGVWESTLQTSHSGDGVFTPGQNNENVEITKTCYTPTYLSSSYGEQWDEIALCFDSDEPTVVSFARWDDAESASDSKSNKFDMTAKSQSGKHKARGPNSSWFSNLSSDYPNEYNDMITFFGSEQAYQNQVNSFSNFDHREEHTYKIVWTPTSIHFYLDNVFIKDVDSSIPYYPGYHLLIQRPVHHDYAAFDPETSVINKKMEIASNQYSQIECINNSDCIDSNHSCNNYKCS